MTRAITALMFIASFAGAAVAQDAMSNTQTQPRTVVGCVSKQSKGKWVITGGGPGPKQFRVIGGNEAALAKLDGHTVRVSGPVGTSDPAVQAITPPGPGTTTGVTYNTIEIEQVQDVSGNCSLHGMER